MVSNTDLSLSLVQKYTRYEISQMQRAAERNVHKYKRRYLAEEAAGVDTAQTAVRLRTARQQAGRAAAL